MAKVKQIFTAPWYPWYVADAALSESIEEMSLTEEGAYRRALDYQWMHGSVPSNPVDLAKKLKKKCTVKIAEKVLTMFEPVKAHPSRSQNKRLENVRKEQKAKHDKNVRKGTQGALTRWKRKASGDSSAIAGPMPKQWHTEQNRTEQKVRKEEEEHTQRVRVPEPSDPLREIFIGTVTAELEKRMDVKLPVGSRREWQIQATWAFDNGFTAEQVAECYDLLTKQHWRDGPVKPRHLSENLPNLQKLRAEIERNQNGANQDRNKSRSKSDSTTDRLSRYDFSEFPTEEDLGRIS